MHTAICTFDDRQRAEQAVNTLVQAGFARHDLHIEHKGLRTEGDANDRWDGLEREVAVDRRVVASFGRFFARLFGKDEGTAHVDTYGRHVERGGYVVVVDTSNQAEADRARTLLQGMSAGDLNVVHRPEQVPLRDIVGMRQGEAGMAERSREAYEGGGVASSSPSERERALASGSTKVISPTTGPDLREPDLERPPGLRYSDKDNG